MPLHFVCKTADLKKNKPRRFIIQKNDLVLVRTKTSIYAVKNRCPHLGQRLDDGIIKNDTLMCVWHGWQFQLQTGECISPEKSCLKTYQITIENDKIFVEIDK